MSELTELTPTEFRRRWPEGQPNRVVLLDVREPQELVLASVASAVHIPMADVPGRLSELDRGSPTVVMCHSGVRSRLVAQFLLDQGFEQVFNLAGGIDAWSREIDPQIPQY